MDVKQLNGILLALGAPLITWAVAKGYIPAGDYSWLAVSGATIIAGFVSAWRNRPSAIASQTVAKIQKSGDAQLAADVAVTLNVPAPAAPVTTAGK